MSTIWENGKYQPLVKYVTLKDLKKLSNAIDIINGDSDTKGSIKKAIKDLVGEAPEAYDTLKEIADKLKSDDDLHKALNDAIILKASSDALNTEINRATSAETVNKNAIDGEVTRAKSAEKSLQDQITSNDSDITNLTAKHESLSRKVQGIAVTGGASTATNVTYNNDDSGLNAENAQDAIDELATKNKSHDAEIAKKVNKEAITLSNALLKYKEAKITLIGDSISTFSSWVPEGYVSYYPQGVIDSVEKTYWNILCSILSASIQNLSYAGSSVTNQVFPEYNLFKRVPFVNCDSSLIIIALGVNDTEKEDVVGEYDYNKDIESYNESIFTEAYIKAVRTLMLLHPKTDILLVAMAPEGSMPNRTAAIKKIAEHYGLMFFDARTCYGGGHHPDTDANDNGDEMKNIANGILNCIGNNVSSGLSDKTSKTESCEYIDTNGIIIEVKTDVKGRAHEIVTNDGIHHIPAGLNTPKINGDEIVTSEMVNEAVSSRVDKTEAELNKEINNRASELNEKIEKRVVKEEGKSLLDEHVADSLGTVDTNGEFTDLELDNSGRMLEGRRSEDGTKVFFSPTEIGGQKSSAEETNGEFSEVHADKNGRIISCRDSSGNKTQFANETFEGDVEVKGKLTNKGSSLLLESDLDGIKEDFLGNVGKDGYLNGEERGYATEVILNSKKIASVFDDGSMELELGGKSQFINDGANTANMIMPDGCRYVWVWMDMYNDKDEWGMHVQVSEDSVRWGDVNTQKEISSVPSGYSNKYKTLACVLERDTSWIEFSLRDPSIIYKNGVFYVAVTLCHKTKKLTYPQYGILKSTNLRDWSTVCKIQPTLNGKNMKAGAPEIEYIDDKVYVIVQLDNDTERYNHILPCSKECIAEISDTILAMESGETVSLEHKDLGIGAGYIDSYITKVGDKYKLLGDHSWQPVLFESDIIDGGYKLVKRFPFNAEGYCVYKVNGVYRINISTGDTFSSPDLVNWYNQTKIANGYRHGSVVCMPIKKVNVDKILSEIL